MKHGFTLIEILVALGIMAVIVPLFLFTLPHSSNADRLARAKTTAIHLSQEKIEQYLSSSYADLEIGVIEPKANLEDETWSHFSRQVEVSYIDEDYIVIAEDNDLKQITVTVFWEDNGKEYEESLSGLKVNP